MIADLDLARLIATNMRDVGPLMEDLINEVEELRDRPQATLEQRDVCEGVEMVREAHEAFKAFIGTAPAVPQLSPEDRAVLQDYSELLATLAREMKAKAALYNGQGRTNLGLLLIRVEMLVEETGEWAEALASGDIVKALHELVDVSYVTDGSFLTIGAGHLKLPGYREVHRANMSKLVDCEDCACTGLRQPEGVTCSRCEGKGRYAQVSEAGRWIKGPDFRPADLGPLIHGV